VVRLIDKTTGIVGPYVLDNKTSAFGQAYDMGHVNAGDTLVFEIMNKNIPGGPMTSDPSLSGDGLSHAYSQNFAGGLFTDPNRFDPPSSPALFPAGVYVGMEDLPGGGDLDYDDVTFVFANVAETSPVPEPGSFAMLGTGALFAAGALRRRFFSR
jgi:hypothetical protein